MTALPFEQTRALSPEHRIPAWLAASVFVATVLGASVGWFIGEGALFVRGVRAVFFLAAFDYLVVSLYDFYEHARLEKEVTGKWVAWVAVPWVETINHTLTSITVISMLLYVGSVEWITVFGPVVFLALGWRDELVYHRRRCAHREDIMHTTAHLAAGVMLAALYAMRLSVSR
jgi:hypothetical protein